MRAIRNAVEIALAWSLDRTLGDPPTALHPVGWSGRAIAALERVAPREAAARRRHGAAVAAALPLAAADLGAALAGTTPGGVGGRTAARGALLWTTIGHHTLDRRAAEVEAALAAGDLPRARGLAARHLVSRSLATADAGEVAAAAIASVAENLADATVAPLGYAAVGGARWALWHRVVNTLDAMWGYRTPPYGELGHLPARLDDAANLLPARAAAAAICLAAACDPAADGRAALRAWRREAHRTASPNAGHPIAAMSGALGVRLSKPGHYEIGATLRPPTAADVARARRLARAAARLVLGAILGVLGALAAAAAPAALRRARA